MPLSRVMVRGRAARFTADQRHDAGSVFEGGTSGLWRAVATSQGPVSGESDSSQPSSFNLRASKSRQVKVTAGASMASLVFSWTSLAPRRRGRALTRGAALEAAGWCGREQARCDVRIHTDKNPQDALACACDK